MKFINKKILIGEKEFPNFNEMSKIMKNYEFSCGYYDITKRITHMGYKKDGNNFCIPIKPTHIEDTGIKYEDNKKIPETY